MEKVLQIIILNKYILIISIIAFIIQFKGLAYLIQNKKSDFSYSEHVYEYYEGNTDKTNLAISAFILGTATIVVCLLYLYIQIQQ